MAAKWITNAKKNKHLSEEDRQEIQVCLSKGMTFKSIGQHIQKDPTTVSYEVKHHRQEHRSGFTKTDEPCPWLLKAPYVCNGCPKRSSASCRHIRYLYMASLAQKEYKTLLTEAREGIPLNKADFYEDDRIISDHVKKGQHINHILLSNPNIKSSRSTVYRHFKLGYYSVSRLDLPRAVKFKPRRSRRENYVPAGMKVGRSYEDYLTFKAEHQIDSHVEMDTVIGRLGGKAIMTLHFTAANFMVGLLLENKSSSETSAKFIELKESLRSRGFSVHDTMPVILTDNGGEFSDAFSFENFGNEKELSLFYCDPMQSSQKPQIEKNHTLFRDIVPQGSSFDDFSQETVNLIFSHVNSVKRSIYHGKSAYQMFVFLFSAELADALGIREISPDDVCQSPSLLKGIADLNKNKA